MRRTGVVAATLAGLALATPPVLAATGPAVPGATVEEFQCFYSGPVPEFGLGDGRIIITPSGQVLVACAPPHP